MNPHQTYKYTFKKSGTCYFWNTKAPARNAEGLTRGFHDQTNHLYDKPEKYVFTRKVESDWYLQWSNQFCTETMKWSHDPYGHFGKDTLPWNNIKWQVSGNPGLCWNHIKSYIFQQIHTTIKKYSMKVSRNRCRMHFQSISNYRLSNSKAKSTQHRHFNES